MLTIHTPRPPGHVYRPGDLVAGDLWVEGMPVDLEVAAVELWNVEVGAAGSGGRVRAAAALRPLDSASDDHGSASAPGLSFELTIPLDAVPDFETRPGGRGGAPLRRSWELRARVGDETDRYRIAVGPAPADVPAEALLEADHETPDDSIWQPPSPVVNRRFVTLPSLAVAATVIGAGAAGWSWGWVVAAGVLLLLGAGLAFVFRYERRWRAAFDYGAAVIRLDRPAYRRGDLAVATVDGVPAGCHAFLEVRELRPGPGERLRSPPLWHSGDRPLLPGASRLTFDLPRDVPATHDGDGTGIVWRLHVRFTRDPKGLGGGHNPRRTLVVRP